MKGGKLYIQLGGDAAIVVDAPSGGRLKVYDVLHTKKCQSRAAIANFR